ncbi:MAG: McrC family protein [Iodobacter sp.]
MFEPIVVREYARLTTATLARNTLDEAQISETAFDWLCELAGRFRSSGASLLQVDGRRWLRLDNYVGVLESPCGQVIEILPKHCNENDCVAGARRLMRKLIAVALQISPRETEAASLELYDAPLAEWVMQQFLLELDYLIKRGLRFDYQRVDEEQRYLRGQLDVVQQMRQPPGRQHFFQIRHDVFLPERPENRLLKSALDLVCRHTQDTGNWRLAHELAGLLHELPASRDQQQDFRAWRNDRLMAHYQTVKSWCELILHCQMPLAVAGGYRGISLLFPMEKLFESYVEQQLRKVLPCEAKLRRQLASEYLCQHQGDDFFQLRPDLALEFAGRKWILDTKWKLLDAGDRHNHYGLKQADFYQLFAYGHKYLGGAGELILLYPSWGGFDDKNPINCFQFDHQLTLQALSFDLQDDRSAQHFIDGLLASTDPSPRI